MKETNYSKSDSQGLVICSKTVRHGIKSEPPLDWQTKRIADSFQKIKELPIEIFEEKTFLTINPGILKISRRKPKIKSQGEDRPKRTPIKKWTSKSRTNMVSRFSSLDYSEMFEEPDSLPVMITLTYPKDWLSVAPTASASKAHLTSLKKRFEREYKQKLQGLWKAEFQRRGAIHFHVFCVAPVQVSNFRVWIAEAWADIVNHPDPEQKEKHRKAGTAVDLALGSSKETPKRTAMYFTKHSSPNSGRKEYQNRPPSEWVEKGSVGRFWGYWHLSSKSQTVELGKSDAVFAARLLRRWHRAQKIYRKVRVVRIDDTKRKAHFRWANRRVKRFKGVSGFLSTDSGLAVAESLARALRIKAEQDF
jgi:hypothetical protein